MHTLRKLAIWFLLQRNTMPDGTQFEVPKGQYLFTKQPN